MRNRRETSIVKKVVVSTTCDHCGKVAEGRKTYGGDRDTPEGWHHFWSGHSDWGNDSVEAHEDWDACSWECYVAIVRKVFDEYNEWTKSHQTLKVDDMDWQFVREMLEAQPRPVET